MKRWKNITIAIPGYDLKPIIDDLLELDILSISVKDFKDSQNSEWFDYQDQQLEMSGDTHSLSILCAEDFNSKEILKKIKKLTQLEEIHIINEIFFQDQDWLLKSQLKFQGTKISKSLQILPPWQTNKNFLGKNVIINPGTGFGTGTHPTTKLCLNWIEENNLSNTSLLDYGSGSGILSIVSKLNWANNVVGAEIDKKAIANSIQNCKLNKIHISFIDLNEKTIQKKYDILIANILAETLIQLSNSFKKLTRKNLVLCGILDKQVPKIIDTYSEWIILENKKNMDGWNLLEGKL